MSCKPKHSLASRVFASVVLGGLAFGVFATPVSAADVSPAPTPPPSWWSTVTLSGAIDAGLSLNPAYPADGLNFGHLFTDKANRILLNQGVLTVQRPIDPTSTDYDLGFKFQFMYGTDARYTHYLGELDYAVNGTGQVDIVEAYLNLHTPWLFPGGIDIKGGQFVTLEGAELIYAPDNLLYSHSYIFNFGIPLKHTGILTTSHVTPWLDIYAGITSGVNTAIGYRLGDNNGAAAFHGGFGLNLFDGALTVLATTHIGAENPDTVGTRAACNCDPNDKLRYLNDVTVIWKATDRLTFTSDLNFIRDDAFNATGYGMAQYAAYAITDWLKIVGRAEIWRDQNGFFVAAYPGRFDFANIQWGFPNTAIFTAPTTYLGLTAGLNITPQLPDGLPYVKGLILRPEVRYDRSLNGTTPFNVGTAHSQFIFGGDLIVKF
jgi:hypothetical protein